MAPFLYRCPATGQNVQGWAADDIDDEAPLSVTCLACSRVHLVDPKTGRTVGIDEKK
jgi:hypothetical protein